MLCACRIPGNSLCCCMMVWKFLTYHPLNYLSISTTRAARCLVVLFLSWKWSALSFLQCYFLRTVYGHPSLRTYDTSVRTYPSCLIFDASTNNSQLYTWYTYKSICIRIFVNFRMFWNLSLRTSTFSQNPKTMYDTGRPSGTCGEGLSSIRALCSSRGGLSKFFFR